MLAMKYLQINKRMMMVLNGATLGTTLSIKCSTHDGGIRGHPYVFVSDAMALKNHKQDHSDRSVVDVEPNQIYSFVGRNVQIWQSCFIRPHGTQFLWSTHSICIPRLLDSIKPLLLQNHNDRLVVQVEPTVRCKRKILIV